jgi:hypothetical protein
MSFEHLSMSNVTEGWARGRSVFADHGRPPEKWTDIQRQILVGLAEGDALDDIAGRNMGILGALLVALYALAFRGLIKPNGTRIEITNMGFEAASEFARKAA